MRSIYIFIVRKQHAQVSRRSWHKMTVVKNLTGPINNWIPNSSSTVCSHLWSYSSRRTYQMLMCLVFLVLDCFPFLSNSLGDRIEWMPFCLGSELINNVTWWTILMVNRLGSFLYGIISLTGLILSLRNRICCSMVSTCLSASHVDSVMLYSLSCSSCLMHSNAPSALIVTTLNTLLLLYDCIII